MTDQRPTFMFKERARGPMPREETVTKQTAFTLIEVLVVIAIIGLLVTILVPSMNKARDYAKRTVCASNLRNIGVGLRSYIGERNDRLPYASFMPSVSPLPLETEESIYISDVLKKRLGNEIGVFECPSDYSGSVRAAPNNGLSYFQSERSSYEYRVRFGGGTMAELSNRFSRRGRIVAENMIWIMRDYDNFHAPAGEIGSRRYLYIDGHVTDFEN